jgi:uncharacterized protein YggE
MKIISTLILMVSLTLAGVAQTVDLRRKIEVNGIAEKEVTPDIVNVSITLKEYIDGKNKISISQLEAQLEQAVTEAGIAKEDLTVNNLSSYNYTLQKKKNPDFLVSKQYGIRFHDLDRFNQIMSKIDPKGILATSIDSYDYSKMADIKNELKLKALIAAKDKATYLLNGIGEKLGGAIDIVENEDNTFPSPRPLMFMAKAATADANIPESDIDVKKIKLSFQVHVVFEIVK